MASTKLFCLLLSTLCVWLCVFMKNLLLGKCLFFFCLKWKWGPDFNKWSTTLWKNDVLCDSLQFNADVISLELFQYFNISIIFDETIKCIILSCKGFYSLSTRWCSTEDISQHKVALVYLWYFLKAHGGFGVGDRFVTTRRSNKNVFYYYCY